MIKEKFGVRIEYTAFAEFEVEASTKQEAWRRANELKSMQSFPAEDRFNCHVVFVERIISEEEQAAIEEAYLNGYYEEIDHGVECDQCGKNPPLEYGRAGERCPWHSHPDSSCDGVLVNVNELEEEYGGKRE